MDDASRASSESGPSRQFAATQHFGRFRSKADIDKAEMIEW